MRVGLFSGPISFLIFPAFLALLIWVGCNFILGGTSTYPGMFAVAMYSALPSLLFYVIVIATLFAGNPENFNLSDMAGTNIGYYLPMGTAPFLKSLLSSIDIFSRSKLQARTTSCICSTVHDENRLSGLVVNDDIPI